MKVLLVYPNSRAEIIGWGDLGAIAEPLALEYVGGAARALGHEVRLLDLRLHPNSLEATLDEFAPDVFGVTGYSMHVLRNLALCRAVKTRLPGCRTVVGGHHATLLPEDFHRPEVDYVVVGEGVRPFRALLAAFAKGPGVPAVPGVWSRVGHDFSWGGDAASFEIDEIPAPDRSLSQDERESTSSTG